MAAPQTSTRVPGPRPVSRPGARLLSAIMMGTLLNPLNSSMIAVALVLLQAAFRIDIATASWLLSAFYLAAAVAQPLMGRFADLFGARRIFCTGLLLVGLSSAVAPLVPTFGWLIAVRVLQALGTSAAYPAGLAIIRGVDAQGKTPAGALGALAVAASVSAALGPVLGGALASVAGWPAIFVVNVPLTAAGLLLALRWLPANARAGGGNGRTPRSPLRALGAALALVDLPGIVLFSAVLTSLLAFLLSLSQGPLWPLLPVAPLAAAALVWRERHVAAPFLNVRMLAAHRALLGVYAQFAAVNVVFYTVFFSVPLWLERVHGDDPGRAGLLMLPISGIGVLATPLAARLVNRSGPNMAMLIGAVMLTVGALLLLVFHATTSVATIVAVNAVLGIPNGFNNLGLQAALYENAPADQMGAAGGQFQTFRYVGAILSTSLLGLVFGTTVSSAGLHSLAYILAAISSLVLVASIPSPLSALVARGSLSRGRAAVARTTEGQNGEEDERQKD